MLLNKVANHRIGAALTQRTIAFCAAGGIRKAGNLQHVAFGIEGLGSDGVEFGLSFSRQD